MIIKDSDNPPANVGNFVLTFFIHMYWVVLSGKHYPLFFPVMGWQFCFTVKAYWSLFWGKHFLLHLGIISSILVHIESFCLPPFVRMGCLYLFNGTSGSIDMINLSFFFDHFVWNANISVISLSLYDTHRIYLVLPLCHVTFILFCVYFICIYVPRSHKLFSSLKFKTYYLSDYLSTVSFCIVIKKSILFKWRNTLWL